MSIPVITYSNPADQAQNMPSLPVAFRQKVEREIKRYGVEVAMDRWRVMVDFFQTENWWPAVAREVETLFDEAYEERNRQQTELNSRRTATPIQLTVNQQQGNMDTNNHFAKDSHSQVFNSTVAGRFMK